MGREWIDFLRGHQWSVTARGVADLTCAARRCCGERGARSEERLAGQAGGSHYIGCDVLTFSGG